MSLPSGWRERLKLPLIAAPMTRVSSPALVSAACRSGIIGSFPSHNAQTIEELARWLTNINEELLQHRNRIGTEPAPLAVNLVVHPSNKRLDEDLDCALAHKVELIITSVGNPAPILKRAHERGCLVFADVATSRHVDRAIAAGVDGLVLLTAGAGGQTGWLNPFAFVRAVRERYAGTIVLAGGISDGVALRAAELLGADLAYMGTKFIATAESAASAAYKQAVVHAGADEIELTTKKTGLLANLILGSPADTARAPAGFTHDNLLSAGEIWSAGHSVVGVHDVSTVADVVDRTAAEYRAAQGVLGSDHEPSPGIRQ